MNLPDDCRFAYYVSHEAWYADAEPAELRGHPSVMVSAVSGGGLGCAWEFRVEELDLSGPAVRLGIFDDAFDAFSQIPEFFAALTEQRPKTLTEVRRILDTLGAGDETAREMPAYMSAQREARAGDLRERARKMLAEAAELAPEAEDPDADLRRIDPPTCGCTDCLTGYSMPLDVAVYREDILARLVAGELDNASMWNPRSGESAKEFVRGWKAVNS